LQPPRPPPPQRPWPPLGARAAARPLVVTRRVVSSSPATSSRSWAGFRGL
jgi:hypothetical protein